MVVILLVILILFLLVSIAQMLRLSPLLKKKLHTCYFNCSVARVLDKHLEKALESGIEYVKEELICGTPFYILVVFKNGTVGRFWNENYPYAWISQGYLEFDTSYYEWSGVRPKRRTLIKLDKAIKKYYVR